jgi:hypothetical protein
LALCEGYQSIVSVNWLSYLMALYFVGTHGKGIVA